MLCDAWIKDMEYGECEYRFVEGMTVEDWEKYIQGENRDHYDTYRKNKALERNEYRHPKYEDYDEAPIDPDKDNWESEKEKNKTEQE